MFKGVRVVRGPDWKWGDQDGGEGCVGTVVESQSPDNPHNVWVRWDSGRVSNYRQGGKKSDLRIFDSAPLGVTHPDIKCTCCCQSISGMRWKCRGCTKYNLCHKCYHKGKHNLEHPFKRIDGEGVTGVDIPCRKWSAKCRSFGIFKGARVIRGVDWEWRNQDGGDGKVGTVLKHSSRPGFFERSFVEVQWPENNNLFQYRCGDNGKMDLRYTDGETGGDFYIDHLPVLDGLKVRPYIGPGDKVRLHDLELPILKELQSSRCGWDNGIAKFRGEVGVVIMVDREENVKVKFEASLFSIHPICLALEEKKIKARVEAHNQDEGLAHLMHSQMVNVMESFKGHCSDFPMGRVLFLAAAIGDVEKVRDITRSNPNEVKFQYDFGETPLHVAAHNGHMEVVKILIDSNAPLEQKMDNGTTALAMAVLGNQPGIVEALLESGCDINCGNVIDNTPLHEAANRSLQKCAEVLLKCKVQRVDVNCKDIEGNTPLCLAIEKSDRRIIRMLVEHPRADLMLQNSRGLSCLHVAVEADNSYAVELILKVAPSMANVQGFEGATALHIAAATNNADIVQMLIAKGKCDMEQRNVLGLTALHYTVTDRCQMKSMEALVTNGADVNAQNVHGSTALHILMEKAASMAIYRSNKEFMNLMQDGNKFPGSKTASAAIYLIEHGADIYVRNKRGDSILDVTANLEARLILEQNYKRVSERVAAASET